MEILTEIFVSVKEERRTREHGVILIFTKNSK